MGVIPQRDALLRLLSDDDLETVNLVKEQLASSGPQILPDLRELLKTDDQRVTNHLAEVIHELEEEKAIHDLTVLCRRFSDEDDIEEACWLLAAALQPGREIGPFKIKLDAWGRQFSHLIADAVSDRERVFQLSQFMSRELGFRGNTEDYYNPRNSLLPVVMETRGGIPITCTLIYILVARRAGMNVEGVNLPGHFIARHGEVLFDPFHRGKILSIADCVEMLSRQNLIIESGHLAEAGHHAILIRILTNLLLIFERTADFDAFQRVTNWLAALDHSTGAKFQE